MLRHASSLAFGGWCVLFAAVIARVVYVASLEQQLPAAAGVTFVIALGVHLWSSWAWLRSPIRGRATMFAAISYFGGTFLVLLFVPNAFHWMGMASALGAACILWLPFAAILIRQVNRARRATRELAAS
jgi:tryptophan-rich sensory protein